MRGCWLLLLTGTATLAAPDAADYFTPTAGLLRWHTTGVLRPDQGSLEFVLQFDRPRQEFGNTWEFLFKVTPARAIGSGANTLMGIFIPPEPDRGLAVLLRSSRDYQRVDLPDFDPPVGRPLRLAVTWSDLLRVYLDGRLAGSTKLRGGVEESLLSYDLSIERFAPYHTQAARISTRARSADELAAAARGPLTLDADTALLATDGLQRRQTQTTRWQRESGYRALRPAWRPETQVVTAGQPVSYPLVGLNAGPAAATWGVRFDIQNPAGQTIATAPERVTIPADGGHHLVELPLPLSRPNWYRVVAQVSSPTGETAEYRSAIAVVPPLDPTPGALAGYYGQHQDWDWSTVPWQQLGVAATRCWAGGSVFLWHHVEPLPGQFQWDRADAHVAACQSAGLEVLGLLGYPSRWAAVESPAELQAQHILAKRPERWRPADLAAWGRYVYETVKRYGDRVPVWEIYNEVNFSPPGLPATFSGTPEDYLALLQTAWRELRRANPRARLAISGFSADVNKAMPSRLLALGALEHCDIFNVHGYSGTAGAASWVREARAQRPTIPLWQTEQMWHQVEDGSKRLYLNVASCLDFLAAGYERFYQMGTTELWFDKYTRSPTPDLQGLAAWQQQLRACDRYLTLETFPGSAAFGLRHRLARRDGRVLTVLGSEVGASEVVVQNPDATAWDVLGQPLPLTPGAAGRVLAIPQLAYLVSAQPLQLSAGRLTAAAPLLTNPSFEETSGDIGMAGLAAGRARDWLFRDKSYDPAGQVLLTHDAHHGKLAYAVTSSGAGRVYLFQYTKAHVAGRYRLTAWLKRTAGGPPARPYFFTYDIAHEQVANHALEGVGGEWSQQTWEFDLPATDKLAVGVGIEGGAGTVVVDEVELERLELG
ncbi:MAG: hypothetical protein IT204_16980 [Fimbriimonadaceae bacterium]|nr:hypothetical protein [Fimbriimonadaceae bacterium]